MLDRSSIIAMSATQKGKPKMNCQHCDSETKRFGKDRKGNQRFRCLSCGKTFTAPQDKPLDEMRLPIEKAVMVLRLLVEGNSIRSTERITGVEKKTIISLLVKVGEKCERLFEKYMRGVKVADVQADEIWGFVQMKNKTRARLGKSEDGLGDAYTWIAMESNSKLVIAWHLGKRSAKDAEIFLEKIYKAVEGTSNRFQMSTDGYGAYPEAVAYSLGSRVDYAQLIKQYAAPEADDHRYSPSVCIGAKAVAVIGTPDMEKVCTSHIERQNLTVRMSMRRMTRLTNGFSKKWDNLRAALALNFAYYNFCRIHKTLRCTPAMEAGITKSVWELKDLLESAPDKL
jgi:transposase-like protein/IS1 family transposase